jgi:hypothetical protein
MHVRPGISSARSRELQPEMPRETVSGYCPPRPSFLLQLNVENYFKGQSILSASPYNCGY